VSNENKIDNKETTLF